MARCFLTGVEFELEDGFVLNRRGAQELRQALKDRVASLQRAIDQLSPLDADEGNVAAFHYQRTGIVRKRHRLVCKAIADALAPGFPEMGSPRFQCNK